MNHLMNNLTKKFTTFIQDFTNVHREAKKQGFVNIMKLAIVSPMRPMGSASS